MASKRESSGCFGLLLGIFGPSRRPAISDRRLESEPESSVYPYRVRDHFLSAAELDFYHVLRDTVQNRAVVLSKVNLWDIFYVLKPHENPGARHHISQKHVDFLLCHPETMRPIVAIELDDSSHQREDRRKRDADVDAVYEVAGLPLLHVPVRRNYETSDIAKMILDCLGDNGTAIPVPRTQSQVAVKAAKSSAPLCPKCGSEMVIRVASQGKYQGQYLYVCADYSTCKTYIPVK